MNAAKLIRIGAAKLLTVRVIRYPLFDDSPIPGIPGEKMISYNGHDIKYFLYLYQHVVGMTKTVEA